LFTACTAAVRPSNFVFLLSPPPPPPPPRSVVPESSTTNSVPSVRDLHFSALKHCFPRCGLLRSCSLALDFKPLISDGSDHLGLTFYPLFKDPSVWAFTGTVSVSTPFKDVSSPRLSLPPPFSKLVPSTFLLLPGDPALSAGLCTSPP